MQILHSVDDGDGLSHEFEDEPVLKEGAGWGTKFLHPSGSLGYR